MKRLLSVCCLLGVLVCGITGFRAHSSTNQSTLGRSGEINRSVSGAIQELVRAGAQFEPVRLFHSAKSLNTSGSGSISGAPRSAFQTELSAGAMMNLNRRALRRLLARQSETLALLLPAPDGSEVELDLMRVDIYASDFTVITSSGREPASHEMGLHYRGIVKGNAGSIAAISIFPDEVTGIYGTGDDNFSLGKFRQAGSDDTYVLYSEKALLAQPELACGSIHSSTRAAEDAAKSDPIAPQAASRRIVRIYEEADYSFYQHAGSVAAAANAVSSYFNEVAAIFENAGITLRLSQLFVWDVPDPYSGGASTRLGTFQAGRFNINGDLGQLLSLDSSIGGASAAQGGFSCESPTSERLSVVEIPSAALPLYSSIAQIGAHEIGDLLGSSNGVEMNLARGFDDESGSAMRQQIVNAPCLQPKSIAGVTPPSHIVIVIEENHSFSEIIGSSSAPYINSLANQGALFTQSFAVEHPSEPNYLDIFSGSNQGVTNDSCPHTFSTANLGKQLLDAGLTFAGFSEGLPSTGSTVCTSGKYARKHNPWVNFTNVPSSANRPLTSFPTDFTTLPTISFVIPNLTDDMHDGTISQGDTWLKSHIDAYFQFAKTHNSLLIVTWDEDDSSSSNQIPTIFVGPMVKQGKFSEHINHFNLLRTLEDLYGLPAAGRAATATAITDVWK